MILDLLSLKDILSIIVQASIKAGEVIESRRAEGFSVLHKEAGSSPASRVLTEADLLSQKVILELINPLVKKYDLGVLAEESADDGSRMVKDYFLAIDPLDGTKSFIEKDEGYAVSIALVERSGEPVVAVVYDPVNRDTYSAIRGEGVLLNNEEFHPVAYEDRCKILTDPGFPFDMYPLPETFSYGGAVMNVIKVLRGEYDLYIKPPKNEDGGGSIWDFAATTLLLKESGFIVQGFFGCPLNLNRASSTYMNRDGYLCCSSYTVKEMLFSLIQ